MTTPTHRTPEELAAEASATAAIRAAAEAAAAEEARVAAEAEAAEKDKAEKDKADAATAAITAERDRVSAIFAACPAGYESARDEAIKTGSSAALFSAVIASVKAANEKARADGIAADTAANGAIRPTNPPAAPTGDEAAAKFILDARAVALGEK